MDATLTRSWRLSPCMRCMAATRKHEPVQLIAQAYRMPIGQNAEKFPMTLPGAASITARAWVDLGSTSTWAGNHDEPTLRRRRV